MSGCVLSEVERVFCGFVAIWRAAVVSSQSGHKTLRLLHMPRSFVQYLLLYSSSCVMLTALPCENL